MEARLTLAREAREQERLALIQSRPPRQPRVVSEVVRSQPAESVEEEAIAGNDGPRAALSADLPPAPFDDEGPSWPDATAEAAFLAEQGPLVSSGKPDDDKEDADPKALPTLDTLVSRIPAAAKASMEELFRARFVTVKRIPRGWFKE